MPEPTDSDSFTATFRVQGRSLYDQFADLADGGSIITVHPDDYRPADPDDPDSPHQWQAGDRVTATPFTVGEPQPITEDPEETSMPEPTEVEYESVRILRLQPGDTLVVRLADHHTPVVVQRVKDDLRSRFPGHEVLVLSPKVDLEIVREGDDA